MHNKSRKTIYVDLLGRAGNQMFQIAFAKYLETLGFGKVKISSWGGFGDCLSGLCLDIPYSPFTFKKGSLRKVRFRLFRRYVDKQSPFANISNDSGQTDIRLKKILERFGIIADRSLTPPLSFRNSPFHETYVRGWFERFEYVDRVEGWVREHYVARELSESAAALIKRIKSSVSSVCVSVRRGDFLTTPNRNVCTKAWFLQALDYLNERLNRKATFFIFSDSPSWCEAHLKTNADIVYEKEGSLSISDKLSCMSSCDHFIISNSTFSWWAQYLGTSADKMVVAPDKWFEDGDCNYLQRMPGWVLLPTSPKDDRK